MPEVATLTGDPPALSDRLRGIRLLVLDVDGVLTDGVIALDDQGVETKHFYVRDGSAIAMWRRSGGKVAILSGRRAACVDRRATELGITTVIQGAASKLGPFRAILETLNVPASETCYMGDDWIDLPPMAAAGLAACPADAASEARGAAQFVAQSPGGRGAVREVIEAILKERGEFDGLVATVVSVGATG
jgi:3-deoxy-D-manno-octulosonate 8-phosphate phosphatase (KDO 8-P phosphatase)